MAIDWEIGSTLAIAVGTVVQSIVAVLLYKLTRDLHRLEKANALKEDPIFRLHFNGFQSQPKDPKAEMVHFMFTVVNEGRRGGTFGDWRLVVDGDRSRSSGGFGFAPAEDFGVPVAGLPNSFASEILGKKPRQKATPDRFVAAGDARQYIGWISANGGYEQWKHVRLEIEPIGGQTGAVEFPWELYWLRLQPSNAANDSA